MVCEDFDLPKDYSPIMFYPLLNDILSEFIYLHEFKYFSIIKII